MKKLVILFTLFIITLSFAVAEIGLFAGIKGNLGFPFGSQFYNTRLEKKAAPDFMPNGGASIYARYELPFGLPDKNRIGVHLEVGFNAHNGLGYKVLDEVFSYNEQLVFNTIDIPLMATYRMPLTDIIDFRAGLGPHFSFALGNLTVRKKIIDDGLANVSPFEDDLIDLGTKLLIGAVADAGFGFNFKYGTLLLNLRYLNDFSKLKSRDVGHVERSILIRRNLTFSVGYELKF